MARRESGFERQEHEHYPTPNWVVDAFAEVVPISGKLIWECACGTGVMAEAMAARGATVFSTDIHDHGYSGMEKLHDFLTPGACPGPVHWDGIFTNPPYGERGTLAVEFIARGIDHIKTGGFLAFLLPSDFDHATTRYDLFSDCDLYAGQIKLTRRIKWFDEPVTCRPCAGTGQVEGAKCKKCRGAGKVKSGPSENHSIFIWQATPIGGLQVPRVWYAPHPLLQEIREVMAG